jgi:GAF domain-containing protein
MVALWRYEPDGTGTVLGASSDRGHPFRAGTRWPLDGTMIVARVKQTGRPTRIDDVAGVRGTASDAVREVGLRSGAGAPIVIAGDIWGVMTAGRADR